MTELLTCSTFAYGKTDPIPPNPSTFYTEFEPIAPIPKWTVISPKPAFPLFVVGICG